MSTTLSPLAVRVFGEGSLRDAVEAALDELGVAPPGGVDVVVFSAQTQIPFAAEAARAAGRALLPVCATPRGVRVGPYILAGRTGCHLCHQIRQARALVASTPEREALWKGIAEGTVGVIRPVLAAPVLEVVAAIASDEVRRESAGEPGRLNGAVIEVASATLAVTRHRFLAEPGCEFCGSLPDDSPQAGDLTLVSRPKLAPGNYRSRDLAAEHEQLLAVVCDPKTGLLSTVNVHHNHPMIMVAAFGGDIQGAELAGYGRTFTYPASVAVAVAETLERLAGGTARARRTVVRATFAELGPGLAIEPAEFGLPSQPPDPQCHVYSPDLPIEWVYAYSFRRGGPVLVPQTFAFYGAPGTVFGSESSNGCALGGNLEEAILHGIFEVAERDAFLSTWYARLPVERFDPGSCADPQARALVAWLERSSGSRLHAFNVTMPERIPAVWLMLVDEDERPGYPRAFCSAGAHLDPDRALWSALMELASAEESTRELVAADTTGASLVAAPDSLVKMEDHLFAAAHPDGWHRFSFLYERGGTVSMDESFPQEEVYRPAMDLLDDLTYAVNRYLDNGYDVVVVDQTAAEQASVGLSSVKVLIPGLLPMVFGHRNRRVDLPRLLEVPVRLGYRSEPLSPGDINPYPHPFP
jgi:ribosomal protein S12 methylthiotransferase accessory factor